MIVMFLNAFLKITFIRLNFKIKGFRIAGLYVLSMLF